MCLIIFIIIVIKTPLVNTLTFLMISVKLKRWLTSPDGAVAISSANGMVGTGFTSRYRLQPRAGF